MTQDRYYRTSTFPLVAFLFTKGEQVAGINPTDDPRKKEFAFVKTPRLEELIDLYRFGDKNNPELLVSVRLYEQARKELLDKLHS